MVKNAVAYIHNKAEAFGRSWLNFTYGFLQNVLAKILGINNLYKSLNKAIILRDEEK